MATGSHETPETAPGSARETSRDTRAAAEAERGRARDDRTGRAAAYQRMQQQAKWVELQVKRAQERGDFDDLPGFGKPLENLGPQHDPDWWVKQLVEREQITGVLPPALQVRKDDAELDQRLDRISTEREARRELEDFNEWVRKARIQPLGGPPMITRERDVEAELERWAARRAARHAAQRASLAQQAAQRRHEAPRRRWRRRRPS